MRIGIIPAIALLALAVTAPAANATHLCNGGYTVIDVAQTVYVVIDEILGREYLFSVWIYCESNGIPGLQRGGVTLLGDADICQNSPNPDSCVYY